MGFLDLMSNKVQETATVTKLLVTLKNGKSVSASVTEAYLKKDFNKILSLLESILDVESDTKKAEAYSVVGLMGNYAKNYEIAENCFKKAIALHPDMGGYYENIGETYLLSGKPDQALESLKISLEKLNDSEKVFLMLIEIYKTNKDYVNLMDITWKYIQKYNKPDWYWGHGQSIFNNSRWEENLNLKSPGTALCYLLMEANKFKEPSEVIEMAHTFASRPFPIFTTPLEEAAYHWIIASNYNKLKQYSKCAAEWHKIYSLTNIPEDLKTLASAEWRANELAGHFDPQIIDKIYNRESTALQGQFMKATILICDVRGFSRFSYEFRHAPQVILQFLQPYFDKSQDIIVSHQGILDKYLGDGFISIFIPDSQDEQGYHESVKRAVNTALDLQKYFQTNIPEWSDIWKRNLDQTDYHQELVNQIGLGFGIHTGFVFIGEVGTLKRKQYTALGNVVNFTARLQSKALKGHVVVSTPIYEYAKNMNLSYKIQEMPEEKYSDLKNIPGNYKLYVIDTN